MRRVIAVIQARMGSTRLPGKVLRDLGGRTVLEWVVTAARESGECEEVIVATTTEAADDAIVALATELRASIVRGPVEDVLTRYLLAAESTGAGTGDAIVRLTADCPLVDAMVIAKCVQAYGPGFIDYVTTDHEHSVAHGFDVEVVAVDALQASDARATGTDRTHVTSYIAAHPDEFRIASVGLDPPSADLRVTLDEPADAELLDAIVAELGREAGDWRAVVALLRARPDLVALNAHVAVKPLSAG
jgi:spore coat polysaccharide biosynthesis protein SpsF